MTVLSGPRYEHLHTADISSGPTSLSSSFFCICTKRPLSSFSMIMAFPSLKSISRRWKGVSSR